MRAGARTGSRCWFKPAADGGVTASWVQRLRINDRVTNIGLGPAPSVSLEMAREKAVSNWRMVFSGLDPRQAEATIPTFKDAAESKIDLESAGWKSGKTEALWRSRLAAHVFPKLGGKRVDRISTADVLDVLTPTFEASPSTGVKVRQYMRSIFGWTVSKDYRGDNPAGDAINEALPKTTGARAHFRSVNHADVGAALAKVDASGAFWSTVAAFRFLVLTAARSGEVRGATWDEIDFEAATWTIPADKMKSGREHRVPLSTAALDVLRRADGMRDGSGLIFPSARGLGMSDSTISKLLRENGIAGVPHGFRSSFRDWAAENGVSRELAESALAPRGGRCDGSVLLPQRPVRTAARRHADLGRLPESLDDPGRKSTT